MWYSLERNLQYVAYVHPFHWIQPELANAGRNAYQWGYYYEEVPALEDPDLCYGIHIQIRPTTYADLVLSAESCEPGGARRQMNFTRTFSLASVRGVGCSEGDAGFYDHLKTLMVLRWLPEARLLMVRALQMADPEERLVLRCVHGKEALSLGNQDDFSCFTAAGRQRVPYTTVARRVVPRSHLRQVGWFDEHAGITLLDGAEARE